MDRNRRPTKIAASQNVVVAASSSNSRVPSPHLPHFDGLLSFSWGPSSRSARGKRAAKCRANGGKRWYLCPFRNGI
jgi:hypothetical protein